MNSYFSPQYRVIQQLPFLGGSSKTGRPARSFFGKLLEGVNVLAQRVEGSWEELPEAEKKELRELAFRVLSLGELSDEDFREKKKFSLKSFVLRCEIKLNFAFAAFTGQVDDLFKAAIALYRLAGVIMDAIEKEEAENTSMFLDQLADDIEKNSSELVPYTKELDAKLEQLLNGVEFTC